MTKRINKNLNEIKDATIDASKVTAKKVIDASEHAKENIQKNLKDVSKVTAKKVKTASANAKKTLAKTSEDITKVVNMKSIKENIEPPLNKSKENIQKNLSELKDVTIDVSKATAKKVIDVSEDLVSSVKKNIAKSKSFNKSMFIQYFGKEISEEYLVNQFKLKWTETHELSDVKDLKIYYKIEANTAYYVVNDKITLSITFI